MATWYRLRTEAELRDRAPFAAKVERHCIAIFHHDGRLRAISDICNHRGGPLSEGRVRGEFVMCPWHAWEYSVVTGKGPAGYDEEQVPVYRLETRDDGVCVELPPVIPRNLLKHKPSHLLGPRPKPPGAPPRVLGISTTAMDAENPRFSTSDCLLEHAVTHLGTQGADTQLIRLRDLAFRPCEGNYSQASRACTWPCAITERDPADELTPVYEGLVHWADVALIATPIRWGSASSLYFKMTERLNCIQNQLTIHNRRLIVSKVVALVITGGQDNIQAVAGGMLTFWAELGFAFRPADWGDEEVWRDWYDADERIIVEIRERSWLRSSPNDVMDQRTCVVLRFRGSRICELRDYTDAAVYQAFLARHRAELPKFSSR